MERPKLLIVEDQSALATQLRWALAGEYHIAVAEDGENALALARDHRPALVTLDLGLPPDPAGTGEGLRVLTELIRQDKHVKVIVITGSREESAALEAIRLGASDYCQKPVQIEELRVILKRAAHIRRLERENEARAEVTESSAGMGPLLGTSAAMGNLFTQIERVAASSTTVLILGESGTGKELVAHAIHGRSPRRDHPFVPIDCVAIPPTLLESELFGHEKGAYTGAHVGRRGKLELAHGGTLFLDEIGELDTSLQVKLLRFLQDHHVERIGGRERIAVDVRVLAATNADLHALMGAGRFREDLYYRLGVVSLVVPPLREREEDILLLANAFLKRARLEAPGKRIRGFTPEAIQAMKVYHWPGNVRELENKIRKAVLTTAEPFLTPADLSLAAQAPKAVTLRTARETVERQLIVEALLRTGGNVTRASEEVGVTRPTFHALLSKLGIQSEEFREEASALSGN